MLAQLLEVVDQVPGGIVLQPARGRRLAGAPLVEQHDPVRARIEEAPHERAAPGARAAMQHDGGLAVRVAAKLAVKLVPVADLEPEPAVGLDLRVEPRCGHSGPLAAAARLFGAWSEAGYCTMLVVQSGNLPRIHVRHRTR